MYMVCQFGHLELELVRDPVHLTDLLGQGLDKQTHAGRPYEYSHTVRMRPKQSNKIPEIKDYRLETGASLKDAKDYIEDKYDLETPWCLLPTECPRFGVNSEFWNEMEEADDY